MLVVCHKTTRVNWRMINWLGSNLIVDKIYLFYLMLYASKCSNTFWIIVGTAHSDQLAGSLTISWFPLVEFAYILHCSSWLLLSTDPGVLCYSLSKDIIFYHRSHHLSLSSLQTKRESEGERKCLLWLYTDFSEP